MATRGTPGSRYKVSDTAVYPAGLGTESPTIHPRLDAWLTPARARIAFWLVLVAAAVLRVVFVLQMRANPYFDDPQLDARFFVEWGRRVAAGELVPDGVFPRAPLYAWFLGAIFRVFGEGWLAPRLVQVALGVATVAAAAWLGRALVSRSAGLGAALLTAFAWPLAYYETELVRESLTVTLLLAATAMVVRAVRRTSLGAWIGAGLVFGVAALARPQVLVVLAAVLAWALATRRARWKPVALAALAAWALLAPLAVHNARAAAGFVLVGAEGGQALWIGNNPAADGVRATAPGTRAGFEEQMADARAAAERAEGRSLSPAEVSRHYSRRALGWVVEHPLDALRLYGRKLALLASRAEFGANPEEPRFFAERFAPIVHFLPIGFGLLFALLAPGVVVLLRARGEHRLLLVVAGAYAATVLLVVVSARHRLPLVPLAAILAATGGASLLEAAVARAWGNVARLAGLALLGAAVTWIAAWPADASRANGLLWLGTAEVRRGDAVAGLRLLDEAAALRPDFADVQRARGAALARLGRLEAARDAFAAAVRVAPDDVDALDGLAETELRLGHHAAALPAAERSIALHPHRARPWILRGRARYAAGDVAGSADDFRASLKRDAGSFTAAYSLGAALVLLAREPEAIDAFQRAIRNDTGADPGFLRSAHDELVRLLRAAGRDAEAQDWARRAAGLPPDAPSPGKERGTLR